jgi:hypothetical protein
MKTLITSLIASALLVSAASAVTFAGYAATGATIAGGSSSFLVSDGGDGFDFDATIAGLTFAIGSTVGGTNDTVFAYNEAQAFGPTVVVVSGNANFSNTTAGLGAGSAFALVLFDGTSGASVTTVGGQAFGFHTDASWTIDANDAGTFGFPANMTTLTGVGSTGTVVPEPSSYALLSGLLALGCVMLRRRA